MDDGRYSDSCIMMWQLRTRVSSSDLIDLLRRKWIWQDWLLILISSIDRSRPIWSKVHLNPFDKDIHLIPTDVFD